MNVQRSIVLNPIEPAALSFRAPVGMETRLDLNYVGQNGTPYSNDIGAQLQLTGRTSTRTATYLLPATDVVNGRARAYIPAGELTDAHGYRLRLVGTLNGEATLLAVGTVMPIAAAGLDVIPEDVIDSIDLAFEYNETVELDVAVWTDAGKGAVYDLSDEGTTISAAVYDVKGGLMLAPFSVTVLDENKVRLSLTVEQVNVLPALCWWNMVASTSAGATTLCEGKVTVTGVIVPPLVETIFMYDYLKPDDLNPVGGQIIHGNFTQNMLKVAKTTQALQDATETLRLVRKGDQIVISLTTWTVTAIREESGWFEFMVLPVQQAGVVGVNPVTFRPPPEV